MAKRRKAFEPVAKGGAVKARLKRRAIVIGVVGLLSVAGFMLYDVGRGPATQAVVINLTDAPVTDVVLSGMGGSWRFDRIEPARAEAVKISRSPDSRYGFHVKYKEGGSVKETDVRLFAGKSAVMVIELAVEPKGISTSLRTEETVGDRFGRFTRGVRRWIGL